ncbi:MAG: hypothetical protein GY839_00870 [candidate division Zixibacteria bacterium]|nr:hypothetical protein [candidate division Zixibacteria bacterium]
MYKIPLIVFSMLLIFVVPAFAYQSLQEIYEAAEPSGEYDKFIELDPEVEYLGNLHISDPINVCLIGNGAIIHGRPYMISIGAFFGRLDVSGCIVIGGSYGIYYSTQSSGLVFNNTIVGCDQYGIATIYQDEDFGVEVWNNIIVDCYYGFYCIEEHHPVYLGYNTVYDAEVFRYAEFCPS